MISALIAAIFAFVLGHLHGRHVASHPGSVDQSGRMRGLVRVTDTRVPLAASIAHDFDDDERTVVGPPGPRGPQPGPVDRTAQHVKRVRFVR